VSDNQGLNVQASVGPPDLPDFLRPAYSNHVNVNFTPHDFRFVFSVLTIPLEPPPPDVVATGTMELHPHAVAEVVVPASLMHGLIALLQTQFDQYLNQFGAPGIGPVAPGDES
jgi:hypothetical protein